MFTCQGRKESNENAIKNVFTLIKLGAESKGTLAQGEGANSNQMGFKRLKTSKSRHQIRQKFYKIKKN